MLKKLDNLYIEKIDLILCYYYCDQFATKFYSLLEPETKKVIGYVYIQSNGLIHDLWVDKNYRNKKLGTFLIKVAIHSGGSYLSVGGGDQDGLNKQGLIDFYKKQGFEPCIKNSNTMRIK